jgi:hypothetical protein
MRALIRRLDDWLRQIHGVFEFSEAPDCVLRLQLTRAPHPMHLGSNVIRTGEPVLELHLWNEHIPPIPAAGPDLEWANRTGRMFIHSLRAAAREMTRNPSLKEVVAVGAISAILSLHEHTGGARMMQRLGFVMVPYHSRWGRFGEFWENLYAWWLMWTFNAVSLRSRQFSHLRRTEMWMPAAEFINRYEEGRTAGAALTEARSTQLS